MESANEAVAQAFVAAVRQRLAHSTEKIKHCVDQLNDEQVWWRPRESQNSIGNVLLHLCGNVQQWLVAGITGERDTRDRPKEFSDRTPLPKGELIRRLEDVVTRADAVVGSLTATQLLEKRRIQGFLTTVLDAILDSVPHFSGHTQEIIYITRLQLGDNYRYKWVPATPEQGAPA
jgi:hypothetical protein